MFKDPTPKKVGFFCLDILNNFCIFVVMVRRSDMIDANGNLFVVKRRFPIEQFQRVLDTFGAKVVCDNYHCEQILKGRDGYFYLVDKVDDAKII